jgi:hypothetical protein
MNKRTDMDNYLYELCKDEGMLIDEGGGGQFSGGYYESKYKLDGHIYIFAIEGKFLELVSKEICYD